MVAKQPKSKSVAEFGDFQTPFPLAEDTTKLLHRLGFRPSAILEPTCGRGAFISAAFKQFSKATKIFGVEINSSHLAEAKNMPMACDSRVELMQGDFFSVNWKSIIAKAAGPWLILGNPPWVTSAELGTLESKNLPEKSNFQNRKGMDAITGKSNFDISEWMLLQYLAWLHGTTGTIAVLCKTAVARKILLHVWKKNISIGSARIYKIDALTQFGAAVDACFFILHVTENQCSLDCEIYENLNADSPSKRIGFRDGHVVSNVEHFEIHRALLGPEKRYVWRSGVKHDCSKVMELKIADNGYQNGLGEPVAIEDTILYPMLKSSDIGNGRTHCRSVMLITQQAVGNDTSYLKTQAPLTWDYLNRHASLLDKRGSVIYKKKPQFSIFGVGPYTFSPWKVAISGFYKKLQFLRIGPLNKRPVVVDDTVYFLPCWSEEEAVFIEDMLTSKQAEAFFQSMIHWDEKRPITVDILKRLSLERLAALLGRTEEYNHFTSADVLPLFTSSKNKKSFSFTEVTV